MNRNESYKECCEEETGGVFIMVKQFKNQGISRKPWLIVGSLLMLVIIGASGCSSSQATSAQPTSQTQSDQGQSNQGQPGQGQRVRNPAEQAAMSIRRLQGNPQNALTSDQKDKIKPILQELIDTANPSQDVLQQKADAINAVLTDQQKSYLASSPQRPAKGNAQNPDKQNNSNGNKPKGTDSPGGPDGQQNRANFKPQDIYQQVLDSLK